MNLDELTEGHITEIFRLYGEHLFTRPEDIPKPKGKDHYLQQEYENRVMLSKQNPLDRHGMFVATVLDDLRSRVSGGFYSLEYRLGSKWDPQSKLFIIIDPNTKEISVDFNPNLDPTQYGTPKEKEALRVGQAYMKAVNAYLTTAPKS